MRIRVQNGAERRALLAAFEAAGCVALPIGETVEIVDEERLEVTFFLRSWAARNPDAQLEIVG